MGKMSGDWDQTTKKMEEVGTGSQISGSKGDDKVESTTKKKTISMERGVTGRFDTNTGKMYINKKEVSSEEYSEFVNMSNKEKIQKYGKIKTNTPKLNKTKVSSDSITPNRKGKDIVVIDDSQEAPMMQSSSEGGSTQILVVGNSLNTLVKQILLTDLAYT